jgi:hypothetical protein
MASLDAEIDALYTLPLAEFTAARNALAARAGDQRATIKALQKPNAAAWAVNQLYWRDRKTYDRLIGASTSVRTAHGRVLAGKKADVWEAETQHRAAIEAAAGSIGRVFQDAGAEPSDAVWMDVRKTLQALPSDETTEGRLVRPLEPMGFGALLKMLPGGVKDAPKPRLTEAPRRSADVASHAARANTPADRRDTREAARDARDAEREARAEEKRVRAEQARERVRLERELRQARATESELRTARDEASDALRVAEREEKRRQAALEEQRFEVRRLETAAAAEEQKLAAATTARAAIERELDKLRK